MRKLKVGHIISASIMLLSMVIGIFVLIFAVLKIDNKERFKDYTNYGFEAIGVVTEGNAKEDIKNGDFSVTIRYSIGFAEYGTDAYNDEDYDEVIYVLHTDYPDIIEEGSSIDLWCNNDDYSDAVIAPSEFPISAVSQRLLIAFAILFVISVIALIVSLVLAILYWVEKSKLKKQQLQAQQMYMPQYFQNPPCYYPPQGPTNFGN